MSKPLDNPLFEPDANQSSPEFQRNKPLADARLPRIVRGRMFCVAHGRQCYQRNAPTGESEWICPDERHGLAILS